MEVQRGRHVRLDTGELVWETWYEDVGPSRARFIGTNSTGGHPHSKHRTHRPVTGFSITLGAQPHQDPDVAKLQAAMDTIEIVPNGSGGSNKKKRKKS